MKFASLTPIETDAIEDNTPIEDQSPDGEAKYVQFHRWMENPLSVQSDDRRYSGRIGRRFIGEPISVNVQNIKGLVAVPPRFKRNRGVEDNPRVNIDATIVLCNDADEFMVAGTKGQVEAYLEGIGA